MNVKTWLRDLLVRGGELEGFDRKTVHVSKTELFGKMVTFIDMPSDLNITDVRRLKLEG